MTTSVVATASGPTPEPVKADTVRSGDFTYTRSTVGASSGDGHDDTITWTFDFSTHPNYPLSASDPLGSALLTTTVTPSKLDDGIKTDTVAIKGLAPVVSPTIQNLPIGVTSTISLELLDHYTSAEILGTLRDGTMPMLWQDDVVMTFAQLHLVQCSSCASAEDA